MTGTSPLNGSGYSAETIFTSRLLFEGVANAAALPDSNEGTLSLGWDWRLREDEGIEVTLSGAIAPTRARPEKVEIVEVGVFRAVGLTQSVAVSIFARLHAPAIIFPYLREAISGATSKGLHGALYLPPFNVAAVMRGMQPELATGDKQLLARKQPPKRRGRKA